MCQAEGHQPIPPTRELPSELLDVRKTPGAKLARHLSDQHDWHWESFRPILDAVVTEEPKSSLLSLLRRAHDSEHRHDDGFLWHDHSCKGVA